MKTIGEIKISLVLYLAGKIINILEDLDGRKTFVDDMLSTVFKLRDLANKFQRKEQMKDGN